MGVIYSNIDVYGLAVEGPSGLVKTELMLLMLVCFSQFEMIIIITGCWSISLKTFTVIQVYAPTTSYDDAVVEQFYEDIFKVLRESKAEYKVIMGDVNGRIRSLQSNEQCFALVTSELVIEMNGVREYWISLHLKN